MQAGLAPVAVALVFSALLLRTGLMELAIGAGFATVIVLAIGFSFEPLTAVCKMVLCGAGTCVLLLLELSGVAPRVGVVVALAVAAGLAAVWVIRRVLHQKETGLALLAAAGATTGSALLVYRGNRASADPLAIAASGLMMGLCAGVRALLGASASLAQVGIANGTSRLDREAGPTFDSLHVPTSCRYCEHPHCMKDRPPYAIHHSPGGEVYISNACIGCGTCDKSCPYGVIQRAALAEKKGIDSRWAWLFLGLGREPGTSAPTAAVTGKSRGKPAAIEKAVKCDMRKDLKSGPACAHACPTGAALRISSQ